jgi:hypothetical protein
MAVEKLESAKLQMTWIISAGGREWFNRLYK